MAGAKVSKNNPDKKAGTQKVNLVLSDVCEACTSKCARGERYLESLKARHAGTGVVCKK